MKIVLPNRQGLKSAVGILKDEGVIIFPTDTAYGLGGIFNSPKVINKILKIKKRQDRKFTLACSSLNQVEKFFKLNVEQRRLAKEFWPGPLSIVVSSKLAVRVPDNKLGRQLAQLVGKPLIATSANLSGQKNIYDSQKVIREFVKRKHQPDLIIAGGKLKKVKPSTVVKIEKGEIKIVRRGSIKI